ncbi:MAG TPA: peptidylprolyl isomerase [Thermoanaerobaculia bacterium]|nr:peptidylprolyl isomerase [Thermoanaerobaculia bacterium]
MTKLSRPLLTIALALGLLLAGFSCTKKEGIAPDVVARVGDRMLTLDDFKHYLNRNVSTELVQIEPEAASALLDQFIEEALVSAWAAAQGHDVSAEQVAAAVRSDPGSTVLEKRDQMRRAKLIADISATTPMPTDEEVRAFYASNSQEFDLGERVRARQILVHDRDLGSRIHAELSRGGSFDELSREHSSAANAAEGGDIGFLGRGELPRMFEDELFRLKPGEISRVIETDSGFHIFRVDDARPAGMLDLEAAGPLIRARLREEGLDREMSRVIGVARKEIPVTVLTKRLPFAYSGAQPKSETE